MKWNSTYLNASDLQIMMKLLVCTERIKRLLTYLFAIVIVSASFTIGLANATTNPVDLSGTVKASNGNNICAMVLASGQFTFSCNPWGEFSLTDLPTRPDGTVKRQMYADGFFPKIDVLTGSSIDEAVVMTRSGACPSYNPPSDPDVNPGSAGNWIDISGNVLVQNTQTPVCAMVLANGQHMFSCDGTGSYDLRIPLDSYGQYKLQVYADGFAPTIQRFDEFSTDNTVRMARAIECQTPSQAMVCELKVKEMKKTSLRTGESLHFETFNSDENLNDIWNSLFGVDPGVSPHDLLTLQVDRVVTWEAGTLTMGGNMKLKVRTDKTDPTLKEIKIEKVGKKDGITTFISGTGGVNPNLADGGWHEVKIKDMDNVTVTFESETVTGFLKELKVKLDRDSMTADPIVRDFKLKLKAETTVADIKKGIVSSVVVHVPQTVIKALLGNEYDEKVKNKPEILLGHTEAEFDHNKGDPDGVDISSLNDGSNDQLKERKGACSVITD